ncbi:MAG TPA: RNA polymerase sigma factor [Planctomycetota bacterium]|nr:RNA polymerase sigma factor [Planctomycetota bacterium]
MSAPELHRTIEAIWRLESARIVAALTRMVRDVGHAEQLAQDAFVQALEQWPKAGVPDQPGAWLMTAARRRAIDALRRDRVLRQEATELPDVPGLAPDPAAVAENEVGDDLLRLMFLCCHPVLPHEARTALTLRLLGGLTTDEIARAYLVPEPTIAQRIVRAKRTLAEQQVPFELPGDEQMGDRMAAVLEVLYLVFNEGYAGTAGPDWTRPDLCEEAMRLSRVLAELAPREPEVHGLAALMELQASRLAARQGPEGDPILLLEQDRAKWDRLLIHRGVEALERAHALGQPVGSYTLQAAIAACHARAATAADTNWSQIVQLYTELARLQPSPIVDLNRAVAVAMAFGPAAGLYLVEQLAAEPSLADYHLLWSVRGDLLARLGRNEEARGDFERAAALTRNARERTILGERAAACERAGRPSTE